MVMPRLIAVLVVRGRGNMETRRSRLISTRGVTPPLLTAAQPISSSGKCSTDYAAASVKSLQSNHNRPARGN